MYAIVKVILILAPVSLTISCLEVKVQSTYAAPKEERILITCWSGVGEELQILLNEEVELAQGTRTFTVNASAAYCSAGGNSATEVIVRDLDGGKRGEYRGSSVSDIKVVEPGVIIEFRY